LLQNSDLGIWRASCATIVQHWGQDRVDRDGTTWDYKLPKSSTLAWWFSFFSISPRAPRTALNGQTGSTRLKTSGFPPDLGTTAIQRVAAAGVSVGAATPTQSSPWYSPSRIMRSTEFRPATTRKSYPAPVSPNATDAPDNSRAPKTYISSRVMESQSNEVRASLVAVF
jgi:hypothetical protein